MQPARTGPESASLIVLDPNGGQNRTAITPLPFTMGRSLENNLVLRDSRVSRSHARIVIEGGQYHVEDCGSTHGTFVNGQRVEKKELKPGDRIEFGAPDSYAAIFAIEGADFRRLMEQFESSGTSAKAAGAGGSLAKLRAIIDLARTIQSSFSIEDVLVSVVDAALAITGAERGFLMLRSGDELATRVARGRDGQRLDDSDLRVPRELLRRSLERRRDLLSMNFDPQGDSGAAAGSTIADLELRSVVCVPLVRIRAGQGEATNLLSTGSETVGLLYMDSRAGTADLAGGNRELLQALAIEASTVLENARLLEEERSKHHLEEELRLARSIQQSLLPPTLPTRGWLRAAGSSVASRVVGGDYFDLTQVSQNCWSAVVADVSGKGVGSALLASLLQGALTTASDHPASLARRLERLNRFLFERTEGEKYATIFYCLLDSAGRLNYVNAAHCPPLLVRNGAIQAALDATGSPVGLLETAEFEISETQLRHGDKLVIYTDGVTEAQNVAGEFFGRARLKSVVTANASGSGAAVHSAIQQAIAEFTDEAPQSDDITVLVLEYAGPEEITLPAEVPEAA